MKKRKYIFENRKDMNRICIEEIKRHKNGCTMKNMKEIMIF